MRTNASKLETIVSALKYEIIAEINSTLVLVLKSILF